MHLVEVSKETKGFLIAVISILLTLTIIGTSAGKTTVSIPRMDTDLSDSNASFLGEDAGDLAGDQVATAGDVNGDGYDDFLIGAVSDDDMDTFAGQVYLVLGKKNGWSKDTNLSTASASFLGEKEDDYLGDSIAGVGDVNDDGFDDFMIGARGNDEEGWGTGQAYLFMGRLDGWTMDTNVTSAYASFQGEHQYDHASGSLAGAGDVNGDGYDDILIGASGSDKGGEGTGQTYLVLGKKFGWRMDSSLKYVDASFVGEEVGTAIATDLAGAGDVNGDGYDDFLISSQWNNDGGENTGQTYLFFGRPEGWSMHTNISEADASFHGEKVNDAAGYSVAGAGDVNADGFDDFLIGSRRSGDGGDIAGQTYLILGKADGWSMDTSLSEADASFWGENEADFAGCSVAGVGDFNGDGYDDFLIGASSNDDKESGAGQTYLILGRAKGWSMDVRLSAANASFWGEGKGDNSGRSLAGAGDVNGDGYDDILIGAPHNDDAGESAGQTYLIFASVEKDPSQGSDGYWGWEVPVVLIAIGAIFVILYFVRKR